MADDLIDAFCPLALFSFALVHAISATSLSPAFKAERLILPRSSRCALLEPVGSKAPAFTGGDVKGVWLEKGAGSSAVLPCPAQGYPVPSYR